MTPRSFFSVFIKILGIYLILSSITVIPQFISTFFLVTSNAGENLVNVILTILLLLLTLFVFFLILRYCIFRTDIIIDKLRLDQGFPEEKFELNMHRSTILSIAIIVIGGIMFIDALPGLCQQIFTYTQQRNIRFLEYPNTGWIIFYFIKTLAGYLLMTNSRQVVNLIERQRKK